MHVMATQVEFPSYIKIPAKTAAVSFSVPIHVYKTLLEKMLFLGYEVAVLNN